jgi:hypothetical protein
LKIAATTFKHQHINNYSGVQIMSDPNYIRKQASRMRDYEHPQAKEDAGWRILSNSDEPGLSDDGSLSQEQMQKAQAIADKVLADE